RLEILASSGEYSCLDQRDHAIRNQFAMHAEILAVHQHGQHGIGNSANARLQHGTVFDKARDIAGDSHLQVVYDRPLQGTERPRRLHESIDIIDMDEAVAVGARHIVVDLRHNVLGNLGGGQGGVDTNSEAAIAVRIGRRDLDQGNVNGHFTAFKQTFNFAEIN